MSDKIFNQDYLYSLCQNYGLRPSKKYGQNFLINPEVIDQMIDAAQLNFDDTVVEVGPGFGPLTFALAPKVKQVYSFEIEKKLEKYWATHAPKNVEIIWGNVLRMEFAGEDKSCSLFSHASAKGWSCGTITRSQELSSPTNQKESTPNYKVVANLPYQITSNVIRKFLESPTPPQIMVLMVQKEVAERVCAVPGGMSVLALTTQYYADAEIVATVPRTDFWPSPQVDSAIIKLVMRDANDLAVRIKDLAIDQLFKTIKIGFSNKRKLLLKNLLPMIGKDHKKQLENVFETLGLAPTVRAQELSLDEWTQITKFIQKNTP